MDAPYPTNLSHAHLSDGAAINKVVALWGSCNAIDPNNNASVTDGHTGYVTALQAIGQADALPGTPSPAAAPYGTRLRPLTDLAPIYQARKVILRRIEFKVYDPTLSGASGQHAATLTAISNSISSQNDMFAQSSFRNGELGGWQPNWFRPRFVVNGVNLFRGLDKSALGNQANKGDLSIGLPLPYCHEDYFDLEKVESIEVSAQAVQYISDTGRFQRYFVQCLCDFLIF